MKKSSTLFLKTLIVLIAIATIIALLSFPQTEGRAANLDLISIYKDPFIIYLYIASIPFFVGLFQVSKLLGLIEQNKTFSKSSVTALKNIKYCAFTFIGFIIAAAAFIGLTVKDDDPAGFIALCVLISISSLIIAAGAHIFEKLIQKKVKK